MYYTYHMMLLWQEFIAECKAGLNSMHVDFVPEGIAGLVSAPIVP